MHLLPPFPAPFFWVFLFVCSQSRTAKSYGKVGRFGAVCSFTCLLLFLLFLCWLLPLFLVLVAAAAVVVVVVGRPWRGLPRGSLTAHCSLQPLLVGRQGLQVPPAETFCADQEDREA